MNKNPLIVRFKKLNLRILWLFFVFVVIGGIWLAHQRSFISLPPHFSRILQIIAGIVITVLLATIFLRLTTRYVLHLWTTNVDVEYRLILSKLYSGMVYLVAGFTILWILGIDAASITILLGFITTGLAFAIRDILMSYLAWFILLAKRPFRIGDYISIGDETGKVLHIGTFFVLLDDSPEREEDYVRIPNKTFLEKPVRNLGKKEVCFTTKLQLKNYPEDYSVRKQEVSLSLAQLASSSELFLETTGEKIFVSCTFYCPYDQRRAVKDSVIGLLYMSFKDSIGDAKAKE